MVETELEGEQATYAETSGHSQQQTERRAEQENGTQGRPRSAGNSLVPKPSGMGNLQAVMGISDKDEYNAILVCKKLSRGYARTYCWGPRGTELGLVGESGGGGGTSGWRGEWRSWS